MHTANLEFKLQNKTNKNTTAQQSRNAMGIKYTDTLDQLVSMGVKALWKVHMAIGSLTLALAGRENVAAVERSEMAC
jgi:hypothetical protein